MKRAGTTTSFRGTDGEILAGSIAEVGYRRLGGVDQWVMIRGESVANPPLILLHGGPGMSETRFFRHFNAPLEASFTVVYWDQRGSGKSFHRDIPRSSMTVAQMLADLDELVDAVRGRLGHEKVVLFGHSWGSALGVLYAARFPEKVVVYVGAGQFGDSQASERASYDYALSEAERRHARKTSKKLCAIGPPPHTAKELLVERMAVARFEDRMRAGALWDLGRVIFGGGSESSLLDLPDALRGFFFSLDTLWPEVSALNLIEAVPVLQMPVFFFVARHDHWVMPQASVAYFDALTAPAKQLVWFERSGHELFVDEPDKFNAAMAELVRPMCVKRNVAPTVGLEPTTR